MIKTFRSRLAANGQDRIRLQTIKGKVGYRLIKFQLLGIDCDEDMETTVAIYKKFQDTITANIDFSDSDLLAAGIYSQERNAETYPEDSTVIFDNEIFNQDIYITNKGVTYTKEINYYLELEVIPLDDAGAEYTTLKDMRSG